VVCGRLRPTGGQVRVVGRDPYVDGAARAALGLAPQALALYPQLTVAENLQAFAALAGLKGRRAADAVRRAMAVTHTEERANSLVRVLSGGFQRRVNIAAAILAEPKLLVLDEPTVGVDLPAREAVTEVLRALRAAGVAILLVTHDLEQAGALADRVGFLREGEKVLEGEPAALIADAFGPRMEIEVDVGETGEGGPDGLAAEGLAPGAASGVWTCLAPDGYVFAGRLAERLQAAGVQVLEVRVRRPSLQHLFARIAGARRAA
jgi:ABC-2 type transport system ATP-binding protein